MNCLEPEDLPTFKKMAAVAIQEIDLQSARPNRTPRPGGLAYETKSHHTPESFRRDLDSLCPSGAECKIYRHPVLKRYQGFYIPEGVESLLLLVSYEIQTCMYIYI